MVIPYPRGSHSRRSPHQIPWEVWINAGYSGSETDSEHSEKEDRELVSYFGESDSEEEEEGIAIYSRTFSDETSDYSSSSEESSSEEETAGLNISLPSTQQTRQTLDSNGNWRGDQGQCSYSEMLLYNQVFQGRVRQYKNLRQEVVGR